MAAKVRRRIRRRIALTVSTVLIGTLLQATVAESAAASNLARVPASGKPVPGHVVKMKPRKSDGEPRVPRRAPKHIWARPGSATVALTAQTTRPTAAGSLPISLTTPKGVAKSSMTTGKPAHHTPLYGKATVRVLDAKTTQRAGVDGVLFTLQPQQGTKGNTVGVSVDYSSFAQAYGGAYAARLKLVRLPACAATTPGSSKCTTATPVATDNDVLAHRLTASSLVLATSDSTDAAPMVLAATSGTSSDHGDYDASPLSASSTWNTNLNTGDFTWSYDMPLPAVPGSFAPQVDLSYSSGGVDGRTSNTNNQTSWVGDGFSLWSGSIERSYKPCADDGVTNADGKKPGDLCWAYDNAVMSFNGHSGELIPTGADSFKLKGDDGTKIDRVYGTARDNGDKDQEYWRVTTTDGTQYYFGYNKLPGWSSGDETTDSTWTVPVYGDDDKEPCHAATFAASWCQQAWRWNLDYAVDVHGNAIAYYYNKETNYYARNLAAADETQYDRGGYLDRIEYGLKSSSMYGTKPLAKVDFTSTERCLPQEGVTCDASTIDDKSFYWYDTPWDLNCKAAADCTKAASPTFWTRKRLTAVTTSVGQTDGTYAPIDTWTLDHRWGKADIDYQLLLDFIQHTGKSATPNLTLPKVTFSYDQRANRLDIPGDNTSPFIKERLVSIDDETGGQLDVTYSTAACDASSLPTPETNTTRCYPVYFTKEGDADPTRQWFNKYVVEAVAQADRTKSSPDMVTRYAYLDGAAWHYDDDEGLTKEKYKTWSTWRGYSHVRVQTGGQDPVGMKSQTEHYFLRGMDGDKAGPSGGTKPVTVSDEKGGTITDHDSAAGYEYKTENYSGPGGKVLAKTVNTPWHHETAKRVRSWGTTTANLTGTESTRTWTSLDDGAGNDWRETYATNILENTAGRIIQTSDYGDDTTSRDNRCTRTTYADNITDWILDLPSRVETVAMACADTPDRSADVLSDVRTAYDGQAYGAFPTKGDATRVAKLKSHNGTTATYLESEFTYDGYGRQATVNDLSATVTATETTTPVRTARTDGRTTTTVYSPTSGYPATVTATTPRAVDSDATTTQTTTTTYDTRRGLPTTVVDTNLKRTDTTYDALGRKTSMWLPNRSKANSDTPNYAYTYTVDGSGPVAVGTKTLKNDGTQRTAYTVFDGFLRTRQIQAPGPGGGRLIADTFFDERGLTAKAFAPYYNTSPPSPELLTLDDALSVESQTWNTYDGLGRVTKSQQVAGNGDGGAVLSTTTTAYRGDRTTVTPPKGGVPTTTVTDARGSTTELWQYHAATPTGDADKTLYEYDPAGRLTKLTDPAGNKWTYTYDQRGNQRTAIDPDKGTTTSYYDDRDYLSYTVDANNMKITHVYDGLGRETETHDGDANGTLLTKHVWDPAGFEGQLASATRYIGGASGNAYTTTYSLYDTLYRPHRTTVTIPASEGALAGSYQANVQYNLDGTVQSTSYPAAGSLTSEVITPTYDDALRIKKLTGTGGVTYLTDTIYSYTGNPLQYTYQAPGAKKTQVTNTYEWGTQRLHNSRVDREDVPGTDKSATYNYDEAGNITAVADVSRDGTDNQCFTYDYLGRLTEAWAQNNTTCASTPSAALLGGPAPYWQSYTYDTSGNRRTETQHDPAGDTSKEVKRAYSYPDSGGKRPHFLSQVDTTGPTGVSQDSYTPDSAGNTATRTLAGDKQTLVWDAEGHLSQVTKPDGKSGTKTTSYIYDADGNRLVTHTDTDTTLYLGSTELNLAKGSTTPKGTRYYDLGGGNQAIRTNDNKLSFLIGDQNGTSQLAINAADLTMQQRRSKPFGAPRGTTPTNWPGTKGYVGGTQDDSLGLVHLGARDYDPSTGRFLSVDPVLDVQNPQQLNAYSYSNSSPVTYSDPTGLESCYPNPSCSNDTVDTINGHKRNDTPGKKGGGGSRSDGNGKGGAGSIPVGTAPDGQPTINGIRVPKYKELSMYMAVDEKRDTYAYRFQKFVHNACSGSGAIGKWVGFCKVADRAGLLGGNKNDPFGIMANIHCVTGHGDCTEAVVGDLLTVAGWGLGKAATSARFLAMAGKEGSASAKVLRAVGAMCSFRPETRVLMKNGHTKAIAKIKPGDHVEAADPETGEHAGARRVTARLVHQDDDLVDLKIRDKHGNSATLHTTSNHPFWDDTSRTWVEAGSLKPGHDLNTPTGQHARLVATTPLRGEAAMYNLTVEQLHTYYVLAGATPVLVHNAGGDDPTYETSRQARLVAMREAGLPTSLQPRSSTYYSGGYGQGGGYQYVYDYNGKTWLVTDNWNDLNADTPHGPHWEVGEAKPGGQRDTLGRLRVGSGKSKANYGGVPCE
ncbi:polymorphic toxin-type HINT domain-containing protein [Streptomyces sp. NBC_00365]|uniref:polymorphic toxin-type HINT domain-containing protein n=1 Tax=Streptomyces sp. NBC_00365 TaxID=2975726 RepID=UPI002254E334|nr:polymorphic toxin-type HINT domain-containing protein [Streptomyces sp. NBC_00365]MCX5092643.1 polymorphic toxin-type HINT domain-containing protein [Streptomyces sp. NBC_00365]